MGNLNKKNKDMKYLTLATVAVMTASAEHQWSPRPIVQAETKTTDTSKDTTKTDTSKDTTKKEGMTKDPIKDLFGFGTKDAVTVGASLSSTMALTAAYYM